MTWIDFYNIEKKNEFNDEILLKQGVQCNAM